MNGSLLLIGCVILICILSNRWLEHLPVPSLLIFIGLGMLFGENGILRIQFNDYETVNAVCSVCLIFIMFYGGFGTNMKVARPVLAPAAILATLGVAGTALGVAAAAHFVLSLPWLESFLIGSVISSTDAASVFNILRSQKLALNYHTDSLLEVESGSNDPMSYMLTAMAIAKEGREISRIFEYVQGIDKELLSSCDKDYKGELAFFAISEKCRGKGLGRKLFQTVVEYMKTKNISEFYLFTDTSCNYLFYEHLGLTRCCEKKQAIDVKGEKGDMTFFIYEYQIENGQKMY